MGGVHNGDVNSSNVVPVRKLEKLPPHYVVLTHGTEGQNEMGLCPVAPRGRTKRRTSDGGSNAKPGL